MIGHNGGPALTGNWIAISREIIEHHIVGAGNMVTPADRNRGSFSRLESWLDLLCMANFRERKINVQGATVILQPGQTLAGRAFLAKRWNWSEKAVRVWLAKLEAELMITLAVGELKQGQTRGHLPNVVSVCNWSKFQSSTSDEGPDLGRPQGHPRATQGPHYNKETKEQDNPSDLSPSGDDTGVASKKVKVRAVAHEAFVEWQDFAKMHGLPVPRDASFETFAQKIALRLQENADELSRDAMLRVWRLALAYVAKSKHCRGDNDRGWRADLEFVCRREKFAKLLSGGFGNGAAPLDDRWRIDAPGTASSVPIRQTLKDSQYADWRADLEAMGIEFHGAPE